MPATSFGQFHVPGEPDSGKSPNSVPIHIELKPLPNVDFVVMKLRTNHRLSPGAEPEHSEISSTFRDTERDLICRTLKQTNGIIDSPRGAAVRLGVKRPTLYSRMQKLGISRRKEGKHHEVAPRLTLLGAAVIDRIASRSHT